MIMLALYGQNSFNRYEVTATQLTTLLRLYFYNNITLKMVAIAAGKFL
jgi:hypothetical protein